MLIIAFGQVCSVGSQHSDKDLTELLQTNPEDLTEADYDKMNLITGSMDPDEYAAKYPDDPFLMDIVDTVSGWVWGTWDKVDIPGAYCSDGSQYKIFVMRSKGFLNWLKGNTKKLMVYMEPGGACWDYESCSGQSGIRGAANPNGIPDNYMNLGDFINPDAEGGSPMAAITPLILQNHPTGDGVETSSWNKVFIPYCTGDVFSGNRVSVYEDPTGENEPLTYRHLGAPNMEKVIDYLANEFYRPKDMMIAGCSAGGTGTLTNYHFFRKALNPKKGIMLDDSGPIFEATAEEGNHYPLHQKIRDVWNVDYLVDKYKSDFPAQAPTFDGNLGLINEALAQEYPNDRLGITMFKRDGNYSGYSYERFFDLDPSIPEEKEQVLALWAEDIAGMTDLYDSYENLHYYIPYARSFNDSHCSTIVNWTGTEYQDKGVDMGDFINDLLKKNNSDIESLEEPDRPEDYDVSDFWIDIVDMLL